jgi:hypothetical protein
MAKRVLILFSRYFQFFYFLGFIDFVDDAIVDTYTNGILYKKELVNLEKIQYI